MSKAVDILRDNSHAPTAPQTQPLSGPITWKVGTLEPDAGFVVLDENCQLEIEKIVNKLRDNPLPLLHLKPEFFQLESCRQAMKNAKYELEEGPGFVIIDKLPVDKFSKAEMTAVYWVLMQLVGRPVAQSWDGKMIYDVRDKGKRAGNGVRPDVTAEGQNFHTDNSFNLCPPHYVGLLCLRPAKQGGISSVVSFYSVYNEMLEHHPELLRRLHDDFLFDRQREHAPGEPKVLQHPLFQHVNGKLVCRLSYYQVKNGYQLAGVEMDELSHQAISTLEEIMNGETFSKEFYFEPGQIQIVDNTRCGHRRTGFVDYDDEDMKRHLVRLWLRDSGQPFYNG